MGHGQPLAPRSAGLSDDALPRLGSPQSSKSCRDRPRASAHALPGSPVPFATALSPAAATSPLLRSPFQTLDATPTRPSPRSATTRRQNGNPHYQPQACDRIFGIDRLVTVLQVQVFDLSALDPERDPPVSADRD